MIERGGGRTSGLTDWQLMDVLSMWACLKDQDTSGQWKQVAGWRKVCDLALAHLSRLQEYRRGLAEAWPPEINAAARAYLAELDQLIDKVQRTHDAAAANHDALAAAARAIGSTRAELQPIYDEYATKLQQKQAYEATLADPKAVAGSRLPEQPPVTDADLERLNVQARGLMTGLSGELQQAQVMLRQPPPVRRPGIETNNPDVYSTSTEAPIVPPIVPVPVTGSNASPAPVGSGVAKRAAAAPTAQGVGPILGGASPTTAAPPPTVAPSITPQPPPLSTPIVGGGSPSTVLPLPPSGQGRVNKPPSERLNPLSKSAASGPPPAATPRPTHPSGLIGGMPGIGLGQPNPKTTPPRRVNPVGGVIGGGGAGTAPSGAAGSRPRGGRSQIPAAHFAPPLGGSPSLGKTSPTVSSTDHRDSSDKPRRWDPDDQWEIDKGVSPVVRPPNDEGPIDPGPAIGLSQ